MQYDNRFEIRDAGPKGMGVYAVQDLEQGVVLGHYQGEVISFDEMSKRYPDLEPDYVFRLSDDRCIDAEASEHWTRYMNHDEMKNVAFELVLDDSGVAGGIVFTAHRAVAAGEELVFDYGVEFWEGRGATPAPGTDSRHYTSISLLSSAQDPSSAALGTPMNDAAVRDILEARGERGGVTERDKREALGRALDYFGVPLDFIPVNPVSVAGTGAIAFADASLGELADAVLAAIAAADEDYDDDEDDDIDWDAWAKEQEQICDIYGDSPA